MLLKQEFGNEPWLSFLGYQSSHSSGDNLITWITKTGPGGEWSIDPVRPIINLEPIYEGHNNGGRNRLATALDVRQASWWSVLATPVAGVSYGGHGVWSWETQPAVPSNHPRTGLARPWHEAIHLPASSHVSHLRAILEQVTWTLLRPKPGLLASQPGDINIQRFVSSTQTEDGRAGVFYFPGTDSTVKIDLAAFPSEVKARWFDPTTGAEANIGGSPFANQGHREFAPPGANTAGDHDWVLVLESSIR
jgi:hypothetical protein